MATTHHTAGGGVGIPAVVPFTFPPNPPQNIVSASNASPPDPGPTVDPQAPALNAVFASSANSSYSLQAAAADTATETLAAPPFVLNIAPNLVGRSIIPGSVEFSWGGTRYFDRLGVIYKNHDPVTGQGVQAGSINYDTADILLTSYDAGDNTITVHSLLTRLGRQFLTFATFRTPGAPLRPGSFSILGVASDGTQISATAEFDGSISGDIVDGYIDVQTGIVSLAFGKFVTAAGNESEYWYDASLLQGDGTVWRPYFGVAETLFYTCVVYSYLPLDADLLGLDPVRLPTDGRVPIVKPGDVSVIHNTQAQQLASGLIAGQQITLNRTGISAVRLYDSGGVYVPTIHYSFDKDTQLLTMEDPLDLSGFTEPLVANHRIEDMVLVSDVQINGQITVAAGITHAYPAADTWVSSALLFGDLAARLHHMFDQQTWTGVWADSLIGNACTANFNDVDYPPVITNAGAIKERWALVFDSTTHFQVIGEKVGIVADGYITNTLQPINPATGQPYFRIPLDGWGSGWAAGNVLRFNTDAANHDLWIARTTLSGPVTEPDDQFTIQIRGDDE